MTCINQFQDDGHLNRFEDGGRMNHFNEINYYDQIFEFYLKIQDIKPIPRKDIDIWESKTILNLMDELKKKESLAEVLKKSILLILFLFEEKENTDTDIQNLPKNQKCEAIEMLEYCI
ncbi:MAG: hypothetical protein ACTSWY_02055 [Promethearchaeota archaeon]